MLQLSGLGVQDRRHDLRGVLLPEHPRLLHRAQIERGEGFQRDVVQVRRILHVAELHQLGRRDPAHAVDRQRAPAAEKSQPARALCAAVVIQALPRDALGILRRHLDPGDFPAADRTVAADGGKEVELFRACRTLVGKRLQHRRDHLAGLFNLHKVANADVLAADLILIVQRRPAD